MQTLHAHPPLYRDTFTCKRVQPLPLHLDRTVHGRDLLQRSHKASGSSLQAVICTHMAVNQRHVRVVWIAWVEHSLGLHLQYTSLRPTTPIL
jgi:hypothetical protein